MKIISLFHKLLSTAELSTIKLGSNWYSGQIGTFEVDCDQCETNVEVQSSVDLINLKVFNGYQIKDYVKYNEKMNVMQATTSLLFVISEDDSLAAVYDFDLPNFDYQCYQATVSEDKMVVYSLCNDGTEFTIYATGCFSITGCSPLGEKFKLGRRASKIQVVQNELFVVLDSDSSNPELIQDGQITLYKLFWDQMNGDQKQLKSLTQIIQIQNFQHLQKILDQLTFKLLNKLMQIQLQINTHINYLQVIQLMVLFSLISHFQTYLNTHLQQLKHLIYTISQINKLIHIHFQLQNFYHSNSFENLNIIIVHKNQVLISLFYNLFSAQYGIQLRFEFQPQSDTTRLITTSLTSIIVRYGDWLFHIENQIIVVVYNIDYELFKDVVLTVSIGSYNIYYEQTQEPDPRNWPLFFSTRRNVVFVSQLYRPLQSNGVYDQPSLILKNKDQTLQSQDITITAKNDYNEQSLQFKLFVQQVDPNECITKITNLQIYPSTGEFLSWNLSQNIFEGTSLKYTLQKTTDFTITQPTSQIGKPINHKKDGTQVISAKALLTQNRARSNQFAFLNKENNKYSIFYTNIPTINAAPSFSQVLAIQKTDQNLNCLDFIQLSTTIFVLDNQQILISNQRQLRNINSNNYQQLIKQSIRYILGKRQSICYTSHIIYTKDGQLANDSQVELFEYLNSQLQGKQTLDKVYYLLFLENKSINQTLQISKLD